MLHSIATWPPPSVVREVLIRSFPLVHISYTSLARFHIWLKIPCWIRAMNCTLRTYHCKLLKSIIAMTRVDLRLKGNKSSIGIIGDMLFLEHILDMLFNGRKLVLQSIFSMKTYSRNYFCKHVFNKKNILKISFR